jgi:thiol-disulfide isomerase/thioredoxin
MPLKPQHRILLMLSAMACAILLSYTILSKIQPSDTTDMEMEDKKEQTARVAMVPAAVSPAGSTASNVSENRVEKLAPVRFYDVKGQPVTLEDFSGQVLLVNLWATWCPPCIAELPSLDKLQAMMQDKGLRVLAISVDRVPVEDVLAFLKDRNLEQLAAYVDSDRQIALNWPYKGVPISFLIGRNGALLQTFNGPEEWTEGSVFKAIQAAVDALPVPAKTE